MSQNTVKLFLKDLSDLQLDPSYKLEETFTADTSHGDILSCRSQDREEMIEWVLFLKIYDLGWWREAYRLMFILGIEKKVHSL